MAVANYHDQFGRYPPAVTYDADGRPAHSWRILVLPFIEQRELFDGATRRLSDDIAPHELRAMCTANGNDSNGLTEHTVEMDDGRKRPLKPGAVSP